jgi:hypothetical protein
LIGVHSVMRRDLLDRLLTFNRFQRYSRLHFGAKTSPLLRPRIHSCSVPRPRFYTLFTGPIFGEHLTDLFDQSNDEWHVCKSIYSICTVFEREATCQAGIRVTLHWP